MDEDEFPADLAVAYDILRITAINEKLPTTYYIENFECQILNLENALNILK